MTVSVTLQFATIALAAHALARLEADPVPGTLVSFVASTITPEDRPDVGAAPAPTLAPTLALAPAAPPALDPATVFGGAVVPAAPTAPALVPAVVPATSPLTAATSPTVAPATGERDSTGLIWDGRIHASTKTKVASGAWTAKRNVDPAFKAQIEADLRGVPAPAAAATAAPVPPAAPTLVAPAAPAAPAAPTTETFASYMARVGGIYTARPVDSHNLMAQALAPHGLQHVGQLAGRPELIPAVDAAFQALLAA